jgi:nucleotide-binding universal stress UspA family protein
LISDLALRKFEVMKRVVVAVDDSDASDRVVDFVNGFFSGMDVEVIGVNVGILPRAYVPSAVPWGGVYAWGYPPVDGYSPVNGPDAAYTEVDQDRAKSSAEETVVSSGLEDADVAVELGDPADAIQRVATERLADLIVVGSNHKSFLQRVFSPSVSHELVSNAALPVLVVQ